MNQEHYFLNCQAIPVFGRVGPLDKMWRKLEEALDFFPDISFLKLGGWGEHQRVQPNLMPLQYVKVRNLIFFAHLFILWKILLSYFSCSLKKKKKISSRFPYRLVREPCASSLQTYLRSKYDLLQPRLVNPLRQ